jgi:hypothetical protein
MGRPRPIKKTVGVVPYVLKDNRGDPAEEQTKFLLEALSGKKRRAVRDALYGASTQRQDTDSKKTEQEVNLRDNYAVAELTVKNGLVGWENYMDEDENGTETEVKWPGSAREAIEGELIGEDIILELAPKLWAMSDLTKEEAGN